MTTVVRTSARTASMVPRNRVRTSPARWAQVVGMSLIAGSAVFPLVFMLFAAFRTQLQWDAAKFGVPTSLSTQGFQYAWVSGNVALFFRNSMVIVTGSLILIMVCATPAAYALSKLRWWGRDGTFLFILSWMAIPPLLLMVPIYVEMVQLGVIDNYLSVILLYAAEGIPFSVYLLASYFRALPQDFVEAAEMDGASVHRTLLHVILPLSKPVFATLLIFNFLFVWNEFVFALLLLQSDEVKPLTVGILQLEVTGTHFVTYWPGVMAGLLITSLPVIGVYLVFQKYLVRGIVAGAIK